MPRNNSRRPLFRPWANDQPGLGIDLDEKLAAKFPIDDDPPFDMRWGNVRRGDGTVVKP
jgi:mannonate dehydratase